MPTARNMLALVIALGGCSGAGELSPFGSGAEGAAMGGTESGGSIPTTSNAGPSSDPVGTDSAGGSGGPAETEWDGELDIVYARCRRTTEPVTISLEIEKAGELQQAERTLGYADVYDQLPAALRIDQGFVAPCDIVLRDADGSEQVLFDCGAQSDENSACAALDPAVSADASMIVFSVSRGSITLENMRADPGLVDPDAEGGEQRYFDLPNPQLEVEEAELFLYRVETGELVTLPHVPGTLDVTPTFLSTGRIAFASSRAGVAGTVVHSPSDPYELISTTGRALQLHTMDISGNDVARISPQTLSLDVYPFQLQDGRIAHATWQAFGMLPYRYHNSRWGSPGALRGIVHLYATGPWGTHLSPLFGQHTHTVGGAYSHVGSNRITQAADGSIFVTEAGGPAGAGTIYAFALPEVDVEGPGPADVDHRGDVFRPADLFEPFPWAAGGSNFAAPVPAPPVAVPGYADPLLYRGFLRDPEALPNNAMMISWAKGGCNGVGARYEEVFGEETPPFTSGSGAFVAMNVMEYSGLDTPGCDAGIYLVDTLPAEHPSALTPLVDTTEFHEIMPRAVVPYGAVHPMSKPAVPEPNLADIEPGSPFGEIAVSSILLRETRSHDGLPFASEFAWATQGTDAVDYADEDLCGVRLLAVQPNPLEDPRSYRNSTGHRTLVLGEFPVRREGVSDPLGMTDTSFRAHVPADVPLLIQGVDCEGRTLNSAQTPFSLRPGEQLVCTGCHQRSSAGISFDDVAAALDDGPGHVVGAGEVPLLAGGETTTTSSWGLAFEFESDVLPILIDRCMPCHESGTPDAGLALDVPGVDPGSTWWTLAADADQEFVPDALRGPGNPAALRKPQLSKYVRFLSSRGSLLYWKAVGERTDGRTDDQFDASSSGGLEDVDFGAEHPTDITPGEAAVIARWIDSGAGATQAPDSDAIPPTLTAALLGSAAQRRIAIGTVDVGEGIDPDSLEICLVEDGGSCSVVAAPPAAEAGTVEVSLGELTDDREVRVSVSDRAGNVAELRRTVRALAGPFSQGAAPGSEDDDGGSSGDPSGTETGDSSDEADSGGSEEGCACRSSPAGPARPTSPGVLVLLLVAATARRGRRTREGGRTRWR